MREHDLDYFENSRRAKLVQQQYAIRNPRQFEHYVQCWRGLTSSDGPGPAIDRMKDQTQGFYEYIAREARFGPDDGTLAPWAVIAPLPLAPDIVLPTIRNHERMQLKQTGLYGYKASLNQTFPAQPDHGYGWVSRIA
jgi:hypothetical protein